MGLGDSVHFCLEGSCEIVVFVLILRSYARLQESDWDLQRVLLK